VHSTIITIIGLCGKYLLIKKSSLIQSVFLCVCLIAIFFTPLTSLISTNTLVNIYIPGVLFKSFENTHLTIRDTPETANTTLSAKPTEKFQSDLPATTGKMERESIVNIPSRENIKVVKVPEKTNRKIQQLFHTEKNMLLRLVYKVRNLKDFQH